MADIRLFFGSTTGNTQRVAELIQSAMGDALTSIANIADASPGDLAGADALILGVSTWEVGELQEDWNVFFPNLDQIDLSGKRVALFGLGDGSGFGGDFVNGMGTLYKKVVARGAEVVGSWPSDGYEYEDSTAIQGNRFVGLAIDEDNQSEKTEERVAGWVASIREALSTEPSQP